MTLKRVWIPTPNYSSGGTKRLLVIHTMEGFTGTNGAYDCAHYFQGNVGASSHVCIDNNRGTVWEGVTRNNAAWTQCGFNGVAIACEQSGYASWSRDYWLANRDAQLWNIADWLREESGRTGIPLVRLTAGQAQSNGRGVCGHIDLGSSGCGHVDPGNGWPWDIVLQRAIGTPTPPPEEKSTVMTPASAYDKDGRLHLAAVNQRNQVCYKGPNGNWYEVNPAQEVQSGVSIDIGPSTQTYPYGEITITYTRAKDDQVCTWQKGVDNPEQWRHTVRGGSYQLWRQLPISF